jgi:hypothetical protein
MPGKPIVKKYTAGVEQRVPAREDVPWRYDQTPEWEISCAAERVFTLLVRAELCRGLPGFRRTAAGGADVVEGDGAAAEKDEGKSQGGQSQGEFVSVGAD